MIKRRMGGMTEPVIISATDIANILNNPDAIRHTFEGTEIVELTVIKRLNIVINLQVGNLCMWYHLNEDFLHIIHTSKIDIPFVKNLIDERLAMLRSNAIKEILS